jgi:hypothetical protein
MRPRCSYCQRPVGPLWLRCPVCRTRRWAWYFIAIVYILTAVAALLWLLFFRFNLR